MANGVDLTMQLLAKSQNKAASRLLERAVQSSHEATGQAAGKILIASRGSKGAFEIIRHYDPTDEKLVGIILESRDKIQSSLYAAIESTDKPLARNAFRIIYTQRFYEALPFLLNRYVAHGDDEEDTFLSDNIDRLLNRFAEAMSERKNRRFLNETVLPGIVAVLTPALKNFHRHDTDVLLLVLLKLFPFLSQEYAELTQYLKNTTTQASLSIVRLLQESRDPAVFRFIFYCMDNPSPPPVVPTTFARRSDIPFLSAFVKLLQEPEPPLEKPIVSAAMKANLASLPHLEWLDDIRSLLDSLGETAQPGLVLLVRNLDLPAEAAQSIFVGIVHHGRPKGRVAALEALEKFSGKHIDELIWEAAGDANPLVQVAALNLIGKRNQPNGASRILQFVDSPNENVRKTVQSLLPDFRFSRFLDGFDQMNDTQRRGMFQLVSKLDAKVVDELAKILAIGAPVDKAKALLCVGYGELVPQLEDSLCGVLTDDKSPAIRAKAAELLAAGRRELSRSTLVQALHRDSAPEVRAAAKASLENRPVRWNNS